MQYEQRHDLLEQSLPAWQNGGLRFGEERITGFVSRHIAARVTSRRVLDPVEIVVVITVADRRGFSEGTLQPPVAPIALEQVINGRGMALSRLAGTQLEQVILETSTICGAQRAKALSETQILIPRQVRWEFGDFTHPQSEQESHWLTAASGMRP